MADSEKSNADALLPGRQVDLLSALNAAAVMIQRSAHSEAEVLQAVREQLRFLGVYGTLCMLEDDRHLVIRATHQVGALGVIEQLAGLTAEGYRFSVNDSEAFRQVLETGQASFVSDNGAEITRLIPKAARRIAGRILKAFGGVPAIFAPIILDGRVQGVLNFAGEGLAATDVPAVAALGNHIAIALDNARLFAQYRSLFESVSDAILVHDSQTGTILDVNRKACELYGYERGQLLGRDVALLSAGHAPFTGDDALLWMRKAAAGQPQLFEWLAKDAGGRTFWVEVNLTRARVGGQERLLAAVRDVTDRQLAEQELRESEEKYRNLVERAGDGILIIQDGLVQYANPAMIEFSGYPAEQVFGAPFVNFIHPEDLPMVADRYRRRMAGEPVVPTYVTRLVHRDGGCRYAEINAGAISFQGPPADLVFVRDVTERRQAESELRWLKEFHEGIVQNMAVGIVLLDAEGVMTFVNPAAAVMVGYSVEELTGRQWTMIVPPDQHAVVSAADRRRLEGKADRYELDLVRGGGARTTVLVSGSPRFESGEFTGTMAVFTDITDRKRIERALQESEEKTRLLLASIRSPVLALREDFSIFYCNEAYAALVGRTVAELENQNLIDLFPAFAETKSSAAFTRAIETGQPQVAEGPVGEQYLRAWVYPTPWGVLSISEDIAEQKRAEEALRQRHEELALLSRAAQAFSSTLEVEQVLDIVLEEVRYVLKAMACSIWLTDSETGDLVCRQVTGPERDAVRGWRLAAGAGVAGWVAQSGESLIVPDTRTDQRYYDRVAEEIGLAIRSLLCVPITSKHEVIGVLQVVDERPGWFTEAHRSLLEPLAASAATAIENAYLYKETRRYAAELETRVAERTAELAAVNQELEAFGYSVSHDLRTPLRSMDGFGQALLDDYAACLDETGQDYLRRIRAASQRMGQLIDDLLVLSRVTRREMRREAVDLSAMAGTIAADLAGSDPERKAAFKIAPGLVAHGDAGLLRVVLENLLGNAWKFTSKQRQATVYFGSAKADGEQVFLVRDNGEGFDMAYAGKLFGAFQRLHPADEFEGTGIGLATVQRIIHRHGGRIWAEGAVGRGATFHFTLPSRGGDE